MDKVTQSGAVTNESDLFRHELRMIAATLRDAADEWEASGDDEKLVNETIDPLISRIAHVIGEPK